MRHLRVMMLGFRGFPGIQGGVETHAEHLCPLLASEGWDVAALVRAPYIPLERDSTWQAVRLHRLWSPRTNAKGIETFAHTFVGIIYAALRRPNLLHIQAIGPALLTPLARLLGLRVVVTHHGPDYDRQKWGWFARWVLRTGESWGMRFAHRRIVISRAIQTLVRDKYGLESDLIPNGVTLPELAAGRNCLDRFGLESRKYVLMVSRLVPEKRHEDLISAFTRANLVGWKLALVGGSDHPDEYSVLVARLVAQTPNVVATGIQTGKTLAELYLHAGLFVLPSSHEGLPIALLEALSYGLPTLASNIPANLEIGLPESDYFPLGDTTTLAQRMKIIAATPIADTAIAARREWVASRYDWNTVASATAAVYRAALGDAAQR